MLSDLEMWSAFVGFVLPPAIAVINQAHWSRAWRFIVAVMISVLAAAITCWVRGDLNNHDYAHSLIVVLTATLTFYHFGWRPSTIAPAIEVATSR